MKRKNLFSPVCAANTTYTLLYYAERYLQQETASKLPKWESPWRTHCT